MPSELHLHVDRLVGHAAAASGLSDELRAALRDVPAANLAVDAAEIERLRGAVAAAARALAELSAAAAAAATAGRAAEAEVAGSFGRLGDALGPPA